jgi:5-oxoprolinase (ATP-hydrolysing)
VVRAVVLYAFRCLVARDIPLNDGCLRPLTIVIPAGTFSRPLPGSAVVAGNTEVSQAVCNALLGALGACASSQATMNNLLFGDEHQQYYETICGGAGAGPGFDGASAVHTHMTNTRITDPEVLELRYPVRVERFAIRTGSGGSRRHTRRRWSRAQNPLQCAHDCGDRVLKTHRGAAWLGGRRQRRGGPAMAGTRGWINRDSRRR